MAIGIRLVAADGKALGLVIAVLELAVPGIVNSVKRALLVDIVPCGRLSELRDVWALVNGICGDRLLLLLVGERNGNIVMAMKPAGAVLDVIITVHYDLADMLVQLV